MNQIARTVIGANFGDEGKGVMTDYLVHEYQSNLVVRFSGGSQAGHTVVTPDGRRHVFNHFGSGSFAGADTLLSHFFIVNPMIFRRERQELELKTPVNLNVTIDWDAPVTTPFDMLINQMVEIKRGGSRHGSCGLGIGETIERGEQFKTLRASDLTDRAKLKEILLRIQDTWVPIRKLQLGLGSDQDHIFMSKALIDNYLLDVQYLLAHTKIGRERMTIFTAQNPVFEGSQGLLLDQGHANFPHVTRSNTGIKNVLSLVNGLYKELEVVYVTRAYLTRHGVGPLSRELEVKPFRKIDDPTNINNPWQGSIRFAYLDIDFLKKTIINDLFTNKTNVKVKPSMAITCLDQCDSTVRVYHQGQACDLVKTSSGDIGDLIAKKIDLSFDHYKSFGPTRKDVTSYLDHEIMKTRHRELIPRRRKIA